MQVSTSTTYHFHAGEIVRPAAASFPTVPNDALASAPAQDQGEQAAFVQAGDKVQADAASRTEQANDQRLAQRDREVRTHELAHLSVGGPYVGRARFTYERGSNGVMYAVGGEVSVNTSPVSNDPEATLAKAEIIRAAALAPAQPSTQDIQVAARAARMANQARLELALQRAGGGESPRPGQGPEDSGSVSREDAQTSAESTRASGPLDLYA